MVRTRQPKQLAIPGIEPPKVRRPRNRFERKMQQELIAWAKDMVNKAGVLELRWLHAIPNGGERPAAEAKQMVLEGEKAGVWDLCLPVARHGFHGLYHELKYGDNGLSDEQKEFGEFVGAQGFCTRTSWTISAAQEVYIWYLDIPAEIVVGLYKEW